MNTELTCASVMALKGDPSDIKDSIRRVLLDESEECFKAMRPFIFAPGIDGNPHYDHKSALDHFYKKDAEMGGGVRLYVDENGLKNPALWNMVARVLRSMGWDMKNGYIVGVQDRLEQKRNSSNAA